jgi:hypothetical protein
MKRVSLPQVGQFYKVQDHASALAVLIAPIDIEHDVPNPRFNNTRNIATCDVWEFNSMQALTSGTPEEYKGVRIDKGMIVKAMEGREGDLLGPVRFNQISLKTGNNGWVIDEMKSSDTGYAEANAFADQLAAQSEEDVPPAPLFDSDED